MQAISIINNISNDSTLIDIIVCTVAIIYMVKYYMVCGFQICVLPLGHPKSVGYWLLTDVDLLLQPPDTSYVLKWALQ